MNEYEKFIQSKQKTIQNSGFKINLKSMNKNLFPFQKHLVHKAIMAGKYAIWADCGLGKTIMQLEWARLVAEHESAPVLILAPLAVVKQTIAEGEKFGIQAQKLQPKASFWDPGIYVSNYDQLDNIDCSVFAGIVLDESSILKNFTGKTKRKIIKAFSDTKYKLACTATPSPNDLNEVGNHSKFLDVLDAQDMRAKWFVRDEGMNNYRLKGHAEDDFFAWVSSWASMLSSPSDIGFKMEGYDLPSLNFIERTIKTDKRNNGLLFNDTAVNATNFNRELRLTRHERIESVAKIVNESDEPFIVWIKHNEEGIQARKLIPDAVEVKGSDKPETKESRLLGFANGDFRVLVTKAKIAQFGLNYQHCNNQVFAALDFSYEGLYQAIRRSYRFGQKKAVNIHIITTDTMKNVVQSISRKERQFQTMKTKMSKMMNNKDHKIISEYDKVEAKTDRYHVINGDSCTEIKSIPDNSMDFSVFSPPFSNLFTYSNSIRDMGNCEDNDEFFEHNEFLLSELYRIIKPGRLVCVHTKDLARYKNSSGYTGLYDFTGDYHRAMERAGFKYHSKVTIWTDPVLEMQRTKTQRLLYKQLRKDSTYTGVGLPEYLTIYRKWEGDESEWTPVNNKNAANFPLDTWQKWASPIWSTQKEDLEYLEEIAEKFRTQSWFDIRRTDVLNDWRSARGEKDEKHIAPLQITVIRRAIQMWSNPGETVFSPFAGIGSEGYGAIGLGRRFCGIELKPAYYQVMLKHLNGISEKSMQKTLF